MKYYNRIKFGLKVMNSRFPKKKKARFWRAILNKCNLMKN